MHAHNFICYLSATKVMLFCEIENNLLQKLYRMPIVVAFSSKIAKNSISLASDERKTLKTACRRPMKCRKRENHSDTGVNRRLFGKDYSNTIVN